MTPVYSYVYSKTRFYWIYTNSEAIVILRDFITLCKLDG